MLLTGTPPNRQKLNITRLQLPLSASDGDFGHRWQWVRLQINAPLSRTGDEAVQAWRDLCEFPLAPEYKARKHLLPLLPLADD